MSENLKLPKSERDLDEQPCKIRKIKRIFSLIEKCKMFRLDVKESVKLCNENNWKCTVRLFLKWSEKYEKNTGDKLAEIAKKDSAEYVLESIDTCKEQQRLLWQSLPDAESVMDSKKILDSLLGLQGELLMLYNDAALLKKMRETVDAEIQKLDSNKSN